MSLEIVNVKDPVFGAQGNADSDNLASSVDDSPAIQNAIDAALTSNKALYFPPGKYYIKSSLIASSSNSDFLKIFGDHRKSCELITDQNIEVLKIRHNYKIENISITQKSINRLGKGIAFGFASYKSEFRSLAITGFEYGIWGKWAIWDTFSDLILKQNKIGIELHRNDLDGNPPAYWNTEPEGWFNNVLNFLNVYVEGGEIGIRAYGMCMTFIGCTTQGQSNTGVWIEGGTSNSKSWNNVIINHYAENTNRVFYIKDSRYTKIEGFFAQGGDNDPERPKKDKFDAVIEIDNSRVKVEGSTGQDWWNYKAILRNNAILQGDIAGSGGSYNIQNGSIRLPEFSTLKYSLSHLTSDSTWHTISDFTPKRGHTYKITLSGIRDGYDPQISEYMLYYWDTSHHLVKEITKKHLELRVSPSGSSIEARLTFNSGFAMTAGAYIYIENLAEKAL